MKKLLSPITRPSPIVRRLVTVVLIFSFLMLLGCGAEKRQQAKDLVEAGTTVSTNLSEYYESLAKQRMEHYKLSTFEDSYGLDVLVAPDITPYNKQIKALKARAALAKDLLTVYQKLGKYIDYDAGTEIAGAAMDLKHGLEDVLANKLTIPGLPGVDLDPILNKAIKEIVKWYQLKQFEKMAPSAEVIAGSIHEMYYREMSLYDRISRDYYRAIKINLDKMIDDNEVASTTAMNDYAPIYGLQMVGTPVLSTERKNYLHFQVREKYDGYISSSKSETQRLYRSLGLLLTAHRILFKT